MTFIELIVPRGALTDDQRQQINERLIPELIRADGAPPELIERGRSITWMTINEVDTLSVGGRVVEPSEAPRYVVRVTVPGGHLGDPMREEMVARITRVLAAVDDRPDRLYDEPVAWVQIVELPDGSTGGWGRIVRLSDIVRFTAKGTPPGTVAPAAASMATGATGSGGADSVIDPVCGMTVPLDDAVVVEHDGAIYGFCNPACRDIFVEQSVTFQ